MRYRRVDMIDRCYIQDLKVEGKSQKEIAKLLNFHPSTISRELRRKGSKKHGSYHVTRAQEAAEDCLLHRRLPRKLKGLALRYVLEKLERRWSPEQISKSMEKDIGQCVSHETIYRFLKKDKDEGGDFYLRLRRGKRRRFNRFPSLKRVPKRALLPNIDERAPVVDRRERFGDWERDTMFGASRKQAILVMLERKTRYIKLRKVKVRTAKIITKTTLEMIRNVPVKSITNDRGAEFLDYEKLNRKIPIYFCHPYTSQERGSVENAIGLVRQYLPKRFDIRSLTDRDLELIENELNSRPRKVLGFRSPAEVFSEEKVALCG